MHYYNLVVQYRFTAECASIRCIDYPLPPASNPTARPIQAEKAQAEQGDRSEMMERSVIESIAAIEEDGAEVIIRAAPRRSGDVPVLEGYG
jgi:allantoin racemase